MRVPPRRSTREMGARMASSAIEFEPLGDEYLHDPQMVFRRLRDEQPCFFSDEVGSWVVSRYDECKEVLRDNERFARDRTRAGHEAGGAARSIQTEDPPAQLILRRRMMRALHRQDLHHVAEAACDVLVDGIAAASGTVDLLADIASSASMALICDTMGIQRSDGAHYLRLSHALSRAMDAGVDPARLPAGRAAGDEVRGMAATWFASLPAQGLLAELDGDAAVQSELALRGSDYLTNTTAGIFNAGFSTSHALVAGLLELEAARPGVLDEAAAAPDSQRAADELVRFLSPAQATSRSAVTDTTLCGQKIRRGDLVVTLMASANRDERAFAAPDELDFDRSPNHHLGFAWGPHVCLGAQLALAYLQALIRRREQWIDRIEVRRVERLDTATLRTAEKIWVEKK